MTTKKFIALMLASVMLFVMSYNVSAALPEDNGTVQPLWQHATNMIVNLNLDNPVINIAVTVTGYSGTTYTNGMAILEKIEGENCGIIKTWEGITSDFAVLQFRDQTVPRESGTYRLTFTVTTVRNGTSETITGYRESTY